MDLDDQLHHSFQLDLGDQGVPSFQILLLVQTRLLLPWLPSILANQVDLAHLDLQQVQGYPDFLSFLDFLCCLLYQVILAFQVVR